MRLLRPHPIVWIDRTLRVWWPFFVALASIVLIVTMGWVAWTVVDERKYFAEEQARDQRQDAALAEVLRDQRAEDEESARRVAAALGAAEELLAGQFAAHDLNVATKLNETLRRIETLLGRPAGLPLDPVTAFPYGTSSPTAPAPAPGAARVAPQRPAPTPGTTTTTTPDQRRCADDPDHPRC